MIITNRKIVGTLIYENTKLKEENKVLSKIDEVSTTPPTSVTTNVNSTTVSSSTSKNYLMNNTSAPTTSAINEELNMKIASVKKVWDTAPNETMTNNNSQQGERKNSLLPATSPTDKCQQQKINNENLSNIKKQSNPNIFTASGTAQVINATSPPVAVSTSAYSGFQHHHNLLQTPTSPPSIAHQIYQNPLAAPSQQQNPAALAAAFHQYNAASGQLSHHDQSNFTGNPTANATNASQASQAGLSHSHGAQMTFPHLPAFAMHQQPNVVAAVAQQTQFNQMALAMMQASSNAASNHPAANMFLTQLNAAQPQALASANSNDHQYNKYTLATANPNAVAMAAQNHAMMKPASAAYVSHHQLHHQQANHHNLQQTAAGGWPTTGQQLQQQVNQQHFFAQLAAAAAAANPAANALTGFVPTPLNLNTAAGASAIIPTNGSQTQLSQNSYHNNRQTAGTLQRMQHQANGRSQPQGQQFPMQLMMNNALVAAAHHSGAHHVQQHQMNNSRTSSLTSTAPFVNNSIVANAGNNYQPNPIQRPNAQQSNKMGMVNQSSNNRNGSNKSYNNQQGMGGKSRQYQNRNSSTPSPGTNSSAVNQTNTSTNVGADYTGSGATTGTTTTVQSTATAAVKD
ncbi:hypothetical protein BLA29_001460 [Euroglyphus maynei]|uniref:Uncharacterized protein n=1 Tax=Euroglyphus maynei TaxID=6958 RepID=A0A1Y3APU7_EURMA|nr:hypothetical protein BLA29_001460 [Euroglyphus maynei]